MIPVARVNPIPFTMPSLVLSRKTELFLQSFQATLPNEEFWRIIEDIKTLLILMQVNKLTYKLLSPKNNLLPFWSIWTAVFRPHSFNEFRILFALNR